MHQNKQTLKFCIVGSPELYKSVRAGFVNQGTTLNRWCIETGRKRQTVEKALKGDRVSRLALELNLAAIRFSRPDYLTDVL